MDAVSDDSETTDAAPEQPLETRAVAWARRGLMCAILFPPAGLVIGILLRLSGDRRGWRVLRWTGAVYFVIFLIIYVSSAADASGLA